MELKVQQRHRRRDQDIQGVVLGVCDGASILDGVIQPLSLLNDGVETVHESIERVMKSLDKNRSFFARNDGKVDLSI